MKKVFPKFDSYACVGDSIKWSKEGYDLTATLEYDEDTNVSDRDCYSPIKIKQWKNDEWFFVGVVIAVARNGIEITDHAASIWGTECNFNQKSNKHLADLALEMEDEALTAALQRSTEIVKALSI